jgi:hypothetical protein
MNIFQWVYARPRRAYLTVLLTGFVAILLVRLTFERKLYLSHWLSLNIGDSIFLPLIAYYLSRAVVEAEEEKYPGYPWHIALIAFGCVFGNLTNGKWLPGDTPGGHYHAIFYWCGFGLMGSPLPIVLKRPIMTHNKKMAMLMAVGYFATIGADFAFNGAATASPYVK